MAHRHERGAVRGRGDGARPRARALPRAAVVLLVSLLLASLPGTLRAQEWVKRSDLAAAALPDPNAWWGEFGRPGWIASLWLDGEAPWTVAGHARGGLDVEEPGRGPRQIVDAAGDGSFTPLTWYDSLRVVEGEGAVWQGYSGALTTIDTRTGGWDARGAEAVLDLHSGDYGWDENSLMVLRSDSLSWIRGEAYGLNRDAAGFLEPAGRHTWGVAGGLRRGRHTAEAAFTEQGIGARLVGTEEESNILQAGSVSWRYDAPRFSSQLEFRRGRARSESFADYFDLSRRFMDGSAVVARVQHRSGLRAGLEYRKQHVVRYESDQLDDATRILWGVLGWEGEAYGGTLKLDVGGGRNGALHRNEWAPAASYAVRSRGVSARVGAERVLHAVWSDLALDQPAFLQRTWAGVLELGVGGGPNHLNVRCLGGRTQDRAIVTRTPLEEYQLRLGLVSDPEAYGFGLVDVDARATWRRLSFSGGMFALSRSASSAQPNVDPGFGARGVVSSGFHAFQGDLAFRFYAGAESVGSRDSELGFGRTLPGYTTSSVGGSVQFGDVLMGVRARNLENEFHEEPWIDSATGLEALGPGRELRFFLTALLAN